MKRIVSILGGMLLVAVLGEAALRFFPVITSMEYRATTPDDPIVRGKADSEYVFSKGWNFRLAHRGHLNNFGYPADRNYETGQRNIVVIGDSYIEGLMVAPEERLQSRLEAMLAPGTRVYGLGRSGQELPQYLGVAQWAGRVFEPDAIVINLIAGDLDNAQVRTPGDYYFALGEGGNTCELGHTERFPKPQWTELARDSALINYLLYNLRFSEAVATAKKSLFGAVAAPAKTEAEIDGRRRAVAACFLERIGSVGLPKERLIFILDGYTPAIYDPRTKAPLRDIDVFADAAEREGYPVIRLQPILLRDHAASKGRYDFRPVDAHWNGRTHQLAAEAVHALLQPLLSSSPQAADAH